MEHYSVIHSVMPDATMIDFPGRLSALMFTSGCNFRCGYCHNFEALSKFTAKTYTFEQLKEFCDRIKKQWTTAVTITGGEPTLHKELPETIDFFIQQGFDVKLDTNGSNPDMLEMLLPKLAYVAMDIKCPLERYDELVHFSDIDAIRRSIKLIMNNAKDYEFRTTLVEPYFTGQEDLNDCGKIVIGAKRYSIQAFIPHDNLPDPALRLQPRTRPSVLNDAADILRGYVKEVIVRGAANLNA